MWEDTLNTINKAFIDIEIEVDHASLKEAIDYSSWEIQENGREPGEQDDKSFLRSGITGSYKKDFVFIDHVIYFSVLIFSRLIFLKRKIYSKKI